MKAAVKPKVASPLLMSSTFFCSLSLHFTSCVSSHLTCSCTKHLAPLLSPSLHVFASSISGHSHNCSLSITYTHTHTHTMGLRFQGSYDTIQILLAAYSREMCFLQSHFPQKSRFSLPSSFDPHGMRGLRQQSSVSAGGPSRPP